jgi:predicted MFS family arabinose efflux permease
MTPPGHPPVSLRIVLGFLFAVRLVLNTGFRFVYPFLPAIARGIGIPLEQAGLLVSARNLAGLATPAVVAVAARGERRRGLMIIGAGMFALGAAVAAFSGVVAGVFVGFVLLGLGKPTFDVAAQSHLADRTSYERRARVLGALELTWAGSLLVGAPAAGLLIDRWGWEAPFVALTLLAGLGAVLTPLLVREHPGSLPRSADRLHLEREATGLLAVAALFSLGAEVTFVVFGAWLEIDFGLSLVALGLASVAVAAAELGGEGGVLAFSDRIGKRRSIAIGLGTAAVAFALLPLVPGLAGALVGLALAFAAFEFTIVATIPYASEVAPDARSRYLALVVVAFGLGRAVGAALGAPLFTAFGIAGPAGLSSLANLVSLVLLLRLVGEHGR